MAWDTQIWLRGTDLGTICAYGWTENIVRIRNRQKLRYGSFAFTCLLLLQSEMVLVFLPQISSSVRKGRTQFDFENLFKNS